MKNERTQPEWIRPNRLPDYTLPTDVAIKVAQSAQGNGPQLEAHLEESSGKYCNVWFYEKGSEDEIAFKRALSAYEKEIADENWYFTMSVEDYQRAVGAFTIQDFGEIGGAPRHSATQSDKAEVSFTYPLFNKMFEALLKREGIKYRKNQTPALQSDFSRAFFGPRK